MTPSHAADAHKVRERRRGREYEDEWRISSDADVRRMLDELRDELQHVSRKLAAIKRYTKRTQASQTPISYEYTGAQHEHEYEGGSSPPLSPRTRHIMQLLEEADELLQHSKPAQSGQHIHEPSHPHQQRAESRWTDAVDRRPKTAPSRQFAGSLTGSTSASSVHPVVSNHLLRAYDELLDRFRSQVLRIDATLAAVD